jgi:hypothetical protein
MKFVTGFETCISLAKALEILNPVTHFICHMHSFKILCIVNIFGEGLRD